jgi:hypothetical protein
MYSFSASYKAPSPVRFVKIWVGGLRTSFTSKSPRGATIQRPLELSVQLDFHAKDGIYRAIRIDSEIVR